MNLSRTEQTQLRDKVQRLNKENHERLFRTLERMLARQVVEENEPQTVEAIRQWM